MTEVAAQPTQEDPEAGFEAIAKSARTVVPFKAACAAMETWAEIERRMKRLDDQAATQIAEITEWAHNERLRLRGAMDRLRPVLIDWAAAEIAEDPLGRKSASTPYGTAGWELRGGRTVVTDEGALRAWAKDNEPRILVEQAPRISKEQIAKLTQAQEDGSLRHAKGVGKERVVPGARHDAPVDMFYVRAVASAVDSPGGRSHV